MVSTHETHVGDKPDVRIEDGTVLIKELAIDDSDLAEYLASAEDQVQAVVEALRLGVRILRLAGTSGDVEMVRRQFEGMITAIGKNVDDLLEEAEEGVSERLDKFATERLQKSLDGHRKEINEEMKKLFGPEQTNSVQKQIDKMLEDQAKLYRRELVQVLEKTDDPDNPFNRLRKSVSDEVKKAVDGVQGLRDDVLKIVAEAKGAAVEAEKGTAKGRSYQELVYEQVDRMAAVFGDTAKDVGDQPGEKGRSKAGDIVVELNPEGSSGIHLRIVFEAKNRRVTQEGILEELDEAKENRSAVAAVAVFSRDDYVPGLRTWRDYHGHRYICVLNEEELTSFALDYSYRCARIDALRSIEAEEVRFDLTAVQGLLKRIKGRLADFQKMQANLTGAKGSLDKVSELIEQHKRVISEDLKEIDRLFQVGQEASVE